MARARLGVLDAVLTKIISKRMVRADRIIFDPVANHHRPFSSIDLGWLAIITLAVPCRYASCSLGKRGADHPVQAITDTRSGTGSGFDLPYTHTFFDLPLLGIARAFTES
jgi:hypothetical protein